MGYFSEMPYYPPMLWSSMKKNNFLLRVLIFAAGLFIISVGVALSVRADLGVSPISCIPYIYSLKLEFTLGELTVLFNILLIILQILLLRKNYRLIQLVQLPVVFVFGLFIDSSLYIVSDLYVPGYAWQTLWCLSGCLLMGVGVFLEVIAEITYLPGEGLAMAVADTFKKEFAKVKTGIDCSMVVAGLISSYIFLNQIKGIREGTIVSAILVGLTARFLIKNLKKTQYSNQK